jgi:urea carboxylase
VKLWNVGVPPSGPMDMYAFRFANALVGNAPDAAGLEFAIQGAVRFTHVCA